MNSYILNLSAYTSPQISESKKGDFVEYGADNNYFPVPAVPATTPERGLTVINQTGKIPRAATGVARCHCFHLTLFRYCHRGSTRALIRKS